MTQVKAKVALLAGSIPAYTSAHSSSEEAKLPARPSDLSVTCSLVADGEVLGLPSQTRPREADLDGCEWQEWLHYCLKVRAVAPVHKDLSWMQTLDHIMPKVPGNKSTLYCNLVQH